MQCSRPVSHFSKQAAGRPGPQGKLAEQLHPPDHRIRVVVADDELFARTAVQFLLRNRPDFEVVGTAASGREAVEVINREQPEVVFLDVNMPEGDAFEVLEKLRGPTRPAVIFTTGSEQFASRAFEFSALDYLVKPFTRARFFAALQRARGYVHRHRHRAAGSHSGKT